MKNVLYSYAMFGKKLHDLKNSCIKTSKKRKKNKHWKLLYIHLLTRSCFIRACVILKSLHRKLSKEN